MKLSRKLIPALAMLLVSAVMMTTASFAWFAINTDSQITGMTVKTTAADNILVAGCTLGQKTVATGFAPDLAVTLDEATLRPVSATDGANFFYVDSGEHVDDDGSAKGENPYLSYAETPFANGDKPYTDYVFQVRATNAGSEGKDVVISALDLIYSVTGSTGFPKAFRVAVFAESENTEAAEDAKFSGEVGTLKTVLKPSDAVNFTEGKAANSVNTVGAVTLPDQSATIGTVGAHTTATFKVVVRLWLEGEDTTCTNETFANFDGTWSFNLTVVMVAAGTAGVTELNVQAASGS